MEWSGCCSIGDVLYATASNSFLCGNWLNSRPFHPNNNDWTGSIANSTMLQASYFISPFPVFHSVSLLGVIFRWNLRIPYRLHEVLSFTQCHSIDVKLFTKLVRICISFWSMFSIVLEVSEHSRQNKRSPHRNDKTDRHQWENTIFECGIEFSVDVAEHRTLTKIIRLINQVS